MKYLKNIIIGVIVMAIYGSCVLWITDGVKLQPIDKMLICWFGITFLGVSQLIAKFDDDI